MTRSVAKQQRARPVGAAEYTELWLATGLAALLFWAFGQRSAYAALLPLAVPHATPDEAILLHWSVCAVTLLFLLPGLCLASLLVALRRAALGRAIFLLCSSLTLLYLSLDLAAYSAYGRHLSEFARFALLPGAADVTGAHAGDWVAMILPRALLLTTGWVVLLWLVRNTVGWIASRSSVAFQWLLAGLGPLLLALALVMPYWARGLFLHRALSAGLMAQLTWLPETAISAQLASMTRDPTWAALERDFRQAYARAFPLIFSRRPFTLSGSNTNGRSNVLVIVMESLRPDALTRERMPRLYEWAQRGLVAQQHYAGSHYSEAGIFALLYGRSPLLYHSTLNAHEPPTWCQVAHRFGMSCAWYSGQPVTWVRQEEFVNARLVDRFEHDDRGDWNQWDRTALARAASAIGKNDAPAISVVYLMSTHFEYRYPAQYARHLPVLASANWPQTLELELKPQDRLPLTHRYLNALAFSDDLIADTIAGIDPTRTLVVLTGDHGEALGDNGRYGHGFAFSDEVARVPFAMVGPGIPATRLDTPSLHVDLLPSVVHWLGGSSTGPKHARDLLLPADPRASVLLAHDSFGQDSADALFIHGARRIRLTLGLLDADLTMRGPEDDRARAIELTRIGQAEAAELREAFQAELDSLWRN